MTITGIGSNYATPANTFNSLLTDGYPTSQPTFFFLHDNDLSGNYTVISGDVGWYSEELSDASGLLSAAPTLQVVLGGILHDTTVTTILMRLVGDVARGIYATSFTVLFKDASDAIVLSVDDTASSVITNKSYEVPSSFVYVEIVYTALNAPNELVHITNIFVQNTVHSLMRAPSRQIFGKVRVTYDNPIYDAATTFGSSSIARGSYYSQTVDRVSAVTRNYFSLFNNTLDGAVTLGSSEDEVGWRTKYVSDSLGNFVDTYLDLYSSPRLIKAITIVGDDVKEIWFTSATLFFYNASELVYTTTITNTQGLLYELPLESMPDIVHVRIQVLSINKPNYPAAITEISFASFVDYPQEELVDIDLLEELTYDDEAESLGSISANEVSITFNNQSKDFYFNSGSVVAKQLKKNRKVEVWLGLQVRTEEIVWYPLGVFWAYKWDVPMSSLVAKVTAFDTLGILGTFSFVDHYVYSDMSIGALCESILLDARKTLPSLTYYIDESLYSFILPLVWFGKESHLSALNKLAECYPMDIYCNHTGDIVISARPSSIDTSEDTWSDSSNVLEKTYPTLYTAVPNTVTVPIYVVSAATQELLSFTSAFVISGEVTRDFIFSFPAVSIDSLTVNYTGTISYTYIWYSWGARITFDGSGTVISVYATGTGLSTYESAQVANSNADSVRIDGPISKDISSVFVQTMEHATFLASFALRDTAYNKYDVDLSYIGDMTIEAGTDIKLLDGIADTNLYRIKRHTLYWNGSLTGTAYLTT